MGFKKGQKKFVFSFPLLYQIIAMFIFIYHKRKHIIIQLDFLLNIQYFIISLPYSLSIIHIITKFIFMQYIFLNINICHFSASLFLYYGIITKRMFLAHYSHFL